VQDGWRPGAIFNVTILLGVGAVAEQNLGARRWLAVYLGGGVLTEFLSLAWEPEGAGNSIAVFALAGSMVALPRSPMTAADICVRLIAATAGVGLLIMQDNHGIGFSAGVAIAAGLAIRDRLLASDSRRLQ
jgi:rhomboid protease GluP